MPDLTTVVPAFDVESIEARPDEQLRKRTARRGRVRERSSSTSASWRPFPPSHDPVALRELFSPAFLGWVLTIDREVDFGAAERQLYFMWRLRERTRSRARARSSQRRPSSSCDLRRELEEANVATYPPGPWNAGIEPFPRLSRLAPPNSSPDSAGRPAAAPRTSPRCRRPWAGSARPPGPRPRPARPSASVVPLKLLEMADRRERDLELSRLAAPSQCRRGRDPARLVHLDAVRLAACSGLGRGRRRSGCRSEPVPARA